MPLFGGQAAILVCTEAFKRCRQRSTELFCLDSKSQQHARARGGTNIKAAASRTGVGRAHEMCCGKKEKVLSLQRMRLHRRET